MSEVKFIGVKKQFAGGVFGVSDFSLTIHDGEFVSFLGSQKGYNPEAEQKAYQIIKDTFFIYDHLAQTSMQLAAEQKPPLKMIKVVYGHKFANAKMHLHPGFKNLQFFTKGTSLGVSEGQDILAPFDGYILFPKYPERDSQGNARTPIPSDLFQMGQEIHL